MYASWFPSAKSGYLMHTVLLLHSLLLLLYVLFLFYFFSMSNCSRMFILCMSSCISFSIRTLDLLQIYGAPFRSRTPLGSFFLLSSRSRKGLCLLILCLDSPSSASVSLTSGILVNNKNTNGIDCIRPSVLSPLFFWLQVFRPYRAA